MTLKIASDGETETSGSTTLDHGLTARLITFLTMWTPALGTLIIRVSERKVLRQIYEEAFEGGCHYAEL